MSLIIPSSKIFQEYLLFLLLPNLSANELSLLNSDTILLMHAIRQTLPNVTVNMIANVKAHWDWEFFIKLGIDFDSWCWSGKAIAMCVCVCHLLHILLVNNWFLANRQSIISTNKCVWCRRVNVRIEKKVVQCSGHGRRH